MDFELYSHRYGKEIVANAPEFQKVFNQFTDVLTEITDEDLIELFQKRKSDGIKDKSLSKVINYLIKQRLQRIGWKSECFIFKDGEVNHSTRDWRLDFVYPDLFSVEVAFNHSSAVTVNLLKPVLASELNHVEKAFQTKFGIIVAATRDMKSKGGFDSAIGTFEGFCLQTKPLMNQLTIPLIIIGLKAPISFEVVHKREGNRVIGSILINETGELLL